MASIYRFSFEHDIIPSGISIISGSIWSGQGRFGASTNALTNVSRSVSIQAAVSASVPTNSTGIRGSYFTKGSGTAQYPTSLVQAGPFEFRMLNNSTSEIRVGGVSKVVQDVTIVEDNRWNLVRFSVDFNGVNASGSLEFNGIRVDYYTPNATTGISGLIINGLSGNLSCIDDVGINDNTGTIIGDTTIPNAIKGFVGGLSDNGDIQNWQQNVASLFPLHYSQLSQGSFVYVPTTNKVISQDVSSSVTQVSQNKFTILNPMTHVTESFFSEPSSSTMQYYYPVIAVGGGYITGSSSLTTYFNIQTVTYNDANGLVYFMGSSKTDYTKWTKSTYYGTTIYTMGSAVSEHNFSYKTYDPLSSTTSSLTAWFGNFDLSPPIPSNTNPIAGNEYVFRDVLDTVYCPMNSKLYSLVAVYNPYYSHTIPVSNPDTSADYNANKSWLQMLILDPSTGEIELSYRTYGVWTHPPVQTGQPATYTKPSAKLIWNPYDQTIYAWCSKFSYDTYNSYYLRSIEPDSLLVKQKKSVFFQNYNDLSSITNPTADLVFCDINNSIYISLWNSLYGGSQVFSVDLTTRTGSIVFPKGVGTAVKRLVYSPARNAIYSFGELESFIFDPIKATYVQSVYNQFGTSSANWLSLAESGSLLSGSIIEQLPLYNINDAVYSPKNSAIIATSDTKVYSLKGSLESSVINALLNSDSLKAGATASGDICTIKIAKPTGSFTSQYNYEGFNIRIDNASSLTTSSLLMGIRENGVNVPLGSPIITWANSTGSSVRSVFTSQNSGSTKWSGSQFETIQFYMQAG